MEILFETLTTYNNALHSANKYTPFELFSGRTHVFNKEINYNTEHYYLQKLNEFQNTLHPKIKAQLEEKMNFRIEKLNEHRGVLKSVSADDVVFRKEKRRNKLTPRFSELKVLKDNKITLISTRKQKLHKAKIKNRIKTSPTSIYLTDSRLSQPIRKRHPLLKINLGQAKIIQYHRYLTHRINLQDFIDGVINF